MWSEDGQGPRFQPATTLMPNANYRIALDLAALQYLAPGAIAIHTSQTFISEVPNWIRPGMPTPVLKVLLLADPEKFKTDPTVKDFEIKLDKLREICRRGTIEAKKDPLLDLQETFDMGQDPDFKINGIYFDLTTADREGPGAVAFSIWDENWQRPLDEITVQFCIAGTSEAEKEKCKDIENISASQGFAIARLASESSEAPIASIQFLSHGQDAKVKGIFRANSWEKEKYMVYSLDLEGQKFRQTISEEFLKDIAKGSTDNNLLVRGETLFAHLFPKEALSFDGLKVQEEVLNFLQPYLQENVSAKDYIPPYIFVRMIQVGPSPSLPIPLGLLAVRMDETKEMNRENGRFLGEYFLVQTPLEVQTYKKPDECLSRWVMVLPPEDTGDDAINNARQNMGPAIDRWVKKEVLPFNNMTKFMYWMNRPQSGQEKDPPIALVTLSHHSRNSLYFYRKDSAKDNPLRSSMINRKFEQPSVAILNGCGTGGEGAVELIRRFNRYGFSTFIAPSTEIEGLMAGTFLKLFADKISKSDPQKAETIGMIYWRTLQQLGKTKPPGIIGSRTFGAKALQFAFLGNDNVPICEPTIENRPSAVY